MKTKKMLMLMLMLILIIFIVHSASAASIIYYPFDQYEKNIKNHGDVKLLAEPYLIDQNSFINGVVNNALEFTGISDCVKLRYNSQKPIFSGPITISFYFRPDYLGTRMALVSFFAYPRQLLTIKIKHGKLYACEWSNPDMETRVSKSFGEKLELGKWHHLVWQMTGKEWNIYLDGQPAAKLPFSITPDQNKSQLLVVGSSYNWLVAEQEHFVGMIDEFRIDKGVVAPQKLFSAKALSEAPVFKGHSFPGIKNIKDDESSIAAKIDPKTQSFVFNGKPEPVMIYAGGGFLAACNYSLQSAREAYKAGMRVFRLDLCSRDFKFGDWWIDDDKYDFDVVDRQLDMLFRHDPDALLLLQIPMSPPPWWGIKHPKEETLGFSGERTRDYKASHSYSSDRWINDLQKAYTAFFEHFKKTPYYKRTIGYVTVSGRYNESFRWGYNKGYKQMTDYSKPEQEAFRKWLAKRYKTIENLRKVCPPGKIPDSFAKISIPTPQERKRQDSNYFIDPVSDRMVCEYLMFLNDNHAEKIIAFTNMIHALGGRDKVIGLYYGYIFSDTYGHGRAFSSESGHYGLLKVLKSPNIDFLLDSMSHFQREMGNAGPTAGVPAEVALHGKLWLDEADIRTHIPSGKAAYSGAKNLDESIAILWRAFGTVQVNRSGLWWFPITGKGCYSHPDIWKAFSRMYQEMITTAKDNPQADHSKAVAVIADPRSLYFRRRTLSDPISGNLVTGSLGPLGRAGVEYDLYIADDLANIPDDYPVYIFLNSYFLDDEKRAVIDKRLRKDNKLLVWNYAAGFFRSDNPAGRYSANCQNMTDLTKIKVEQINSPEVLTMRFVKGSPIAAGTYLKPNIETIKAKPVFVINDPKAQILAKFSGASAIEGKVAAAFKQCNNHRNVYISVPRFSGKLLRSIAKLGGAHIYTEAPNGPVVRVGNGHILLHSNKTARIPLRLPFSATKIIDVISGKTIAQKATEFNVNINKNSTIYLRIEP